MYKAKVKGRKSSKTEGFKKRATDLHSLIIRSAGECEKCGDPCPCPTFPKAHKLGCPLTCSHIVRRDYTATRTDLTNGQCLCFTCHARFEAWPREFSRWITDTIGTEVYELLREKAESYAKNPYPKFDWEAEHGRLTSLAKDMGIK